MKEKKKAYITPTVASYEYLIEQGFAGSSAPHKAHKLIEPQEYQYQRNENNWGWNWNTPTTPTE